MGSLEMLYGTWNWMYTTLCRIWVKRFEGGYGINSCGHELSKNKFFAGKKELSDERTSIYVYAKSIADLRI
jgi:hypothetical protein